MSDDVFHKRIHSIVADADFARGTEGLASTCWPGGLADRTNPMGRAWLSRWRPARAAAPLPVCSCQAGRCAVCN